MLVTSVPFRSLEKGMWFLLAYQFGYLYGVLHSKAISRILIFYILFISQVAYNSIGILGMCIFVYQVIFSYKVYLAVYPLRRLATLNQEYY